MPVNMRWDNDEKTIYVAEYIGRWTWEELFASMRTAEREMDSLDHACDIIHDWSQSRGFPPNAMANAKGLIPRMHPNTRLHVHVGASSFFMSMWRVFVRIYEPISQKKRFLFADTMDEARQQLLEYQRVPQ